MQNKQILLTTLLAFNVLNAEISPSKNSNIVVSETFTKKDLEKLATKADIYKLMNPAKRTKWFILGAFTGAAATCVLRGHKTEIKKDLTQQLAIISNKLERLVSQLKTQLAKPEISNTEEETRITETEETNKK